MIEVMVALVLGLILLGGILQVYLGSKASYRFSQGLARLQEDSRLVVDIIARDIRMAGYVPCGLSSAATTTSVVVESSNDEDWWLPFFSRPIHGYEGGAGAFPTAINDVNLDVDSDALLILRGGSKVADLRRYDEANQQILLRDDLGASWVSSGELMIVCDQDHTSLFQAGQIDRGSDSLSTQVVTRISTTTDFIEPGNCTSKLGAPGPATCNFRDVSDGSSYVFGEGGFLSNVIGVIYHVRQSSFGGGKSIYREYLNVDNGSSGTSLQSDSEELVTGVESLQIEYGLDLVGDDQLVDRYVTADAVRDEDWINVITVRLGILFASENGVSRLKDEKTYYIAGTVIAPDGVAGDLSHALDRRIRFASNTLIQVRN